MSMIGKSLAHYSIIAQIGKGGMGEVYQATDTKLDREVVIKVLPEEFVWDANRVARFEPGGQAPCISELSPILRIIIRSGELVTLNSVFN